MSTDDPLVGTMPTYRDIYPEKGAVGRRYLLRMLKGVTQRDCIFVLSKLSRHYVKYCQMSFGNGDDLSIYRTRCEELLSQETIDRIRNREAAKQGGYSILFPELSVVYVIKLCLKYSVDKESTEGEVFSKKLLETMGDCLLVANSIFADAQLSGVSTTGRVSEEFLVNITKQLIVDKNFLPIQKFYQSRFLFCKYLVKYKDVFDIEEYFVKRFKITIFEYFSFLFLVYSQFQIRNTKEEDYEMPHLKKSVAFENLHSRFDIKILDDLLINSVNYKKIGEGFWDVTDILGRPLLEIDGDVIIPLSFRRLLLSLTDSVYFYVLDSLPNETKEDIKIRSKFSDAFGKACEDYFFDIASHIDESAIRVFEYRKGKETIRTPDAILVDSEGLVFFECKKKQFHTLEFLQSGTKELYYERLKEFCYVPLKQITDRIADFRAGNFEIANSSPDAYIYPIIVCPTAPPIFSGAWDMFNLQEVIYPEAYNTDKRIAPPEFIDFAELEYIEAYLAKNSELNLIKLIKLKRSDVNYRNANWMVFLQLNNMVYPNNRLIDDFLDATKDYKTLLFTD